MRLPETILTKEVKVRAEYITNIPNRLIILDQVFNRYGKSYTSIVECPICGIVFEKDRASLKKASHTICRVCINRETENKLRNSDRRIIKNVVGWVTIVEQYYSKHNAKATALVECPICGKRREIQRNQIQNTGSTRCQSCNKTGELNYNYKGGGVFDYGTGWQKISRLVMERDSFTCRYPRCEIYKNYDVLHVHHIIPLRNSQNNSPENLITLCPNHHLWSDKHLDKSIPLLQEVINA